MRSRIARIVLIGSGMAVLALAIAMGWLKAHEDELVFAAGLSRQHLTLDFPSADGFGGHVDALYEHVDALQSALAGLVPAILPPRNL